MDLGQMIQYTNTLAAQNNSWSAEQAEKQMQFQKNLSDTAHQREVADLKAAGLNPVLSASHNGASTPAGAMGGTDNGNIEAVVSLLTHFGEGIAQATAAGAAHGASYGSTDAISARERMRDKQRTAQLKEIEEKLGLRDREKAQREAEEKARQKRAQDIYNEKHQNNKKNSNTKKNDTDDLREALEMASALPGKSGRAAKSIAKFYDKVPNSAKKVITHLLLPGHMTIKKYLG